MSSTPKISIIIPVYNVESYIEKCIISIMQQSFTDYEAIIVDDGSLDSSINICERLVSDDDRFKILHKDNGGLMSAWKYGLKFARGYYVGFVDSDDWIDSNMYEILYNSIVKFTADVVFSGYITEDNKLRNKWTRDKLFVYEGSDIRNDFIKEYCCSYFSSSSKPSVCRWDKLYKRDLLIQNIEYFNEKVSLAEDFNTNIPVILDSQKIVLLPHFTPYHYRYNPKSIVNTVNPKAFENIKELGLACEYICKSKNIGSVYINSFIGNLVFEEVNRILREVPQYELNSRFLCEELQSCNGYFYLTCYAKVRSTMRIYLYNWFIQHKLVNFIRILIKLNNLR